MHITYILQSLTSGKLYIGSTSNFADRFERHNKNRSKSTKQRGPWILLHFEIFHSKSEACKLEYTLKKWKNKKRVLAWISKQKAD
ncbi:MAG: GIY-YIG nuclease family protein [Chitinophagales bacterium]|nr:GIY-YIG nuclease family protein [Chitinophagales bacterium]